jgi:hypothetical protein
MIIDLNSLLTYQGYSTLMTTTATRPTVTTNDRYQMPGSSVLNIRDIFRQYKQQQLPGNGGSSAGSIPPHDFLLYTQYAHNNRLWCQSGTRDYCPLVISFMLIVIFLSLLFILCLCYSKELMRTEWIARLVRAIRRKLHIKSTTGGTSRASLANSRTSINSVYESTVVVTNGAEEDELHDSGILDSDDAQPRTSSIFSRLNNMSFMSHASSSGVTNVWFTDLSKCPAGTGPCPPPPPSYEESQLMISISKEPVCSGFSRMVRSYPRKVSNKRPIVLSGSGGGVNNGFIVESAAPANTNLESNECETIGPITVTEAPCTSSSMSSAMPSGDRSRGSLERIGRRLLEQNRVRLVRQSDRAVAGALGDMDIPPAYETVISENSIITGCGKRVASTPTAASSTIIASTSASHREYII